MDAINDITRPSMALLGLEPWRATYELLRSAWSTVPVAPQGDGHRVVVFPGLCSSSWAVAPMIRLCQRLGYRAHDWGRGLNAGPGHDLDAWLRELSSEMSIDAQPAASVTLVGWSLGGLYAREIAKLAPRQVRQVITIGSPFNADADYTRVGWLFNLLSGRPIKFDEALVHRLRTPPPMPTTSIYTRQDGVVAWQTCIHHKRFQQAEDIEVVSSHLGMGWNPAVMSIIADRLAQEPETWKRYQRMSTVACNAPATIAACAISTHRPIRTLWRCTSRSNRPRSPTSPASDPGVAGHSFATVRQGVKQL